jgi:hypothetical protein
MFVKAINVLQIDLMFPQLTGALLGRVSLLVGESRGDYWLKVSNITG